MSMTVGIRREDKAWERRVALVPQDVKYLVEEQGVKIVVQSSTQEK